MHFKVNYSFKVYIRSKYEYSSIYKKVNYENGVELFCVDPTCIFSYCKLPQREVNRVSLFWLFFLFFLLETS